MRSLHLLVLPLLVVLVLLLVEAGGGDARGAITGGWQRIKDVGDAHVREIGEYAVKEHDRVSGAGLAFVRVLRGETQVVAGVNYRLVVEANNSAAGRPEAEAASAAAGAGAGAAAGNQSYEAVVWEKTWQRFRKLTSFRPLK